MENDRISKLFSDFESLVKGQNEGVEFWCARDLQSLLGYTRWENFSPVVEKAAVACKNSEISVDDHFLRIVKMVSVGSGVEREVEDIAMTRYACYLVAQCGDPKKEPVAFAKTYFAVKTRQVEVIEKRLTENERLSARDKLKDSENQLSRVIAERLGDTKGFAKIRSKGDSVLFGGKSTQGMKDKLGIPSGRPLADFLPTVLIKAKDLATEITVFNVRRDDGVTSAVTGLASLASNGTHFVTEQRQSRNTNPTRQRGRS